ncbi:TBC1 domain family member 13 isoform X2 [Glycine max]|uniref:TBC1 domain family member 13 isoform X2 n=1 Tax=Glycine max TaxID=3847 RepID=UPI001B356C7F|nr:TBC1 domain family member 13 isoform X2 [Glycine max]
MVKKKVPDWLNSSLWSSSSPSSPPSSAVASPFEQPPPPPPRPPSPAVVTPSEPPPRPPSPPAVHDPLPTQRIDDSPREDHGDGFRSAHDVSRQAQLLAELSKKVVDMSELRSLACQGIPDAAGIRSTAWKLLLGYLPPDRGLWSAELAKKRSQYKQFKEEIFMNPDTEIIDQIDRDVKRTHPDMHFFSGDSQFAKSNQEALKNILIIFAKLNPGVQYVQGMNEILAPLFYVLKNDPDEENAASAEADAFFCFVELLSGFRDNFVQQLDNSVVGIRSTITRLSQLLREHDEELWRHLEVTSKVNPQFYAFRWITLLLTQEFNFADSLHIWDTLLSDPDGPQETLLRVCCAMLVLVRKRLLAGDFTSNLKLLQNYPTTNISHLLYVANKFRVQSV